MCGFQRTEWLGWRGPDSPPSPYTVLAGLPPNSAAQGTVPPGLECLRGWGTHHFSGQLCHCLTALRNSVVVSVGLSQTASLLKCYKDLLLSSLLVIPVLASECDASLCADFIKDLKFLRLYQKSLGLSVMCQLNCACSLASLKRKSRNVFHMKVLITVY